MRSARRRHGSADAQPGRAIVQNKNSLVPPPAFGCRQDAHACISTHDDDDGKGADDRLTLRREREARSTTHRIDSSRERRLKAGGHHRHTADRVPPLAHSPTQKVRSQHSTPRTAMMAIAGCGWITAMPGSAPACRGRRGRVPNELKRKPKVLSRGPNVVRSPQYGLWRGEAPRAVLVSAFKAFRGREPLGLYVQRC